MVLAQYYNFVRFGREGYAYVMETMQQNARALAEQLGSSGDFELIGADEEQLPLVAFKLAEQRGLRRVRHRLAARPPSAAGWCPPTRCRRTRST